MVNRNLLAAGLAALSMSGTLAAGGGGDAPAAVDPDYAQAVSFIESKRYADAIPLLLAHVGRTGPGAHAENWLGYAYRHTGRLEEAFKHYGRALAIDPKHRGAHEYVGEAYLMAGNLAKAEEHLKILDRLCWLPCEEHRDLEKAVAAYKAGSGRRAASTSAR